MFRLYLSRHFTSLQRSLFVMNEASNPVIATHHHHHLRFIHSNIPISKPIPNQPLSLTVSYLIDSCGLSPQSGLSAANKFTIGSTENADSVLNLFKSYGFSDTQIQKLIGKLPSILCANPDTIIRPKLDFFVGVAEVSGTQLADFIVSQPCYLTSSLEKRLKPNFDLLKSFYGTNSQLGAALRRNIRLLGHNLETSFLPNIRTLQLYGVPGRNIAKLATRHPRVLTQNTDQFSLKAESIRKIGFDPLLGLFVEGLATLSTLTSLSWDRKVALHKSMGWSEAQIIHAFTKFPLFMSSSEEKVRRITDFLARKMHLGPSFVSSHPLVLGYSLEKRIIPRCFIISLLSSEGLIKKELGQCSFLFISEEKFLDEYVTKYVDQVPKVLDAFNGNSKVGKFEVGAWHSAGVV